MTSDEMMIADLDKIRAEMVRLTGMVEQFEPMLDNLIKTLFRTVTDRERLSLALEAIVCLHDVNPKVDAEVLSKHAQQALDALNEDRRTH